MSVAVVASNVAALIPSTEDRLADIVVEVLRIDRKYVTAEITMAELGADYLEILDVILRAEEAFGVNLTDDDLETAPTLGDLAALFERKRSDPRSTKNNRT